MQKGDVIMISPLQKVSNGVGATLLGINEAFSELERARTDRVISWMKEMIAAVKELAIDTSGKTVQEVLPLLMSVLGEKENFENLSISIQAYLAENTTSDLGVDVTLGIKSVTFGGKYEKGSEKSEAGNVAISIYAAYNTGFQAEALDALNKLDWNSFESSVAALERIFSKKTE